MPIHLKNVSFTYAEDSFFKMTALTNVNLSIEDGEYVGVMGRTGSGKTTLIQLIAGLLRPTSGKIFIDGEDIHGATYDKRKLRNRIGIVFQFPEYQLFETTVERDVAFGLKNLGLTQDEMNERTRMALEQTGFSFEKVRAQSPLALSGGEKRRVAIAGALAVQPKTLIFDEPLSGLDPQGRLDFLRLTAALNATGTTIIMISHDTDCLAEYARRIIALENGELALDGCARTILSGAEKLRTLQLQVSQSAIIAEALRRRDVDLASDIVRYADLRDALIRRMGLKGKICADQ